MDPTHGSFSSFINQYGSMLVNTQLIRHLCSPRESIAVILGVISVISWGIAEVPQIITTYREKSTEGFSVGFLMAWIVGDIFNIVGCLLEPATLPTQFYMALLYTATTAILTAQTVYYSCPDHRLKAGKVCRPEKTDEIEYNTKEKLIGKNSDEKESKLHEYKGSNSLLAGFNVPSSPISVASPIVSYGSTGRDLYYRSARSLSTSPMPNLGSWLTHVRDPYKTPPNGMPNILTDDVDSSSEPLLCSPSSPHDAQPLVVKNTLCVVSSAAFFLGIYVLKLPSNSVFDTKPQGLVIPVGRKLLQHYAVESLLGEHFEGSGIGTFLGWAMAAIYMGGRLPQIWLNIRRGNVEGLSPFMFIFALVGNSTYVGSILANSLEWSAIRPNLPWLVDAGGCVLLDAFILVQFIYFNYRKAAWKAAVVESFYGESATA
ncbi:uncharacterized protein LOC110026778 isoform X2 [Phalaenopsis equestris]|nr:uncharacterized protein LOC110026778 isoform X2 [Phalaenopsis equestris]XP_020583553.1 uncharacterized protein LOC110026778 isoform X2 [Phalaenopsis equestris]XP_020583554.1 uncharacterized protein LOC110026778 isoform X2 [Phalaenopsis equestris]